MRAYRGNRFYFAVAVCLLVIATTSLAIAAEKQGSKEATTEGNEKVAVVNGVAINRAEFDRDMDGVKQQFLSMGQPMPPERLAEVQNEVLQNLISTELLYQEAQKQGIKVEASDVEKRLASLKQRFPTEDQFNNVLDKMNLTEAGLKSQLERSLVIEKLIDQEVNDKISVSDEEIKAYYDANPSLFKQPEQVRASHILVKVDKGADAAQKEAALKKIQGIQQKLKGGADFATLAKESSDCPSSAKGGDLGYFRRGQMVKPFEDAAFALKPGEMSDIVETQFGYHIIKLTDKKTEAVIPLDDVKERLGQYLKQQKSQKEVAAYIAKLTSEAKIEKYLDLPSEQKASPAESKKK